MSRTIDERVVSMQFDNKNFESNVRTSLSTLDKLKQSLNFKGASKGLEGINASVKKVDMSSLGNAAQTVGLKFSAMYTMADQALRNITTRVQQTATHMIKAFTIDPVKTGLNEYETQINAVQTILANTQSKGTTLDDVNVALDELNKYADMTIYNFTEMTRNIGTFTAAGIDLNTSVNAIQGIANLAAISGSTSQQASTAMYQLSQALATGTVKLMDWNSVVNAGMGGQVFQDALKETSKELNTGAEAAIKAEGSFRESLKTGWLTSEVLTETLKKFTTSGAAEYIADYTGLTSDAIAAEMKLIEGAKDEATAIDAAAEALAKKSGKNKEEIKSALELAYTAQNAATKVKTFTQLMDTLKEAAQSGWTQTWEILIGDFEEAKELWTAVSDTFGGIINSSAEARNTMLEGAMTSNWDKLVKKINEAGVETTKFEEKLKSTAEAHGIDVNKLIEDHGSLEAAFRSGAISSTIMKEAIAGLEGSLVDLSKIEKGLSKGSKGEDVKKVQKALKDLGYDLGNFGDGGVDGIIGKVTEKAIKDFQKAQGLEVTGIIDEATIAALEKASGSVDGLFSSVHGLIGEIDKLGGRELLIESFKNAWEALTKPLKAVKKAWSEVFPPMTSEQLYNIIEKIKEFSEKLIMSDGSAEKIGRTFKGLFSILKVITTLTGGGLKLAFSVLSGILEHFDLNILDVAASIGDALTAFSDWIFTSGTIPKVLNSIVSGAIKVGTAVKDWIEGFMELPAVQENIRQFRTEFSNTFDKIWSVLKNVGGIFGDFFENLTSMDGFSFENVKMAFVTLYEALHSYFTNLNITDIFSGIGEALKKFKDNAKKYLESAGIKVDEIKNKIIAFVKTVKEKLGDNMGTILAIGVLLSFLLMVKKIKDAVSLIAKPFDAIDDFLGDLGKTLKSFGQAAKSVAFKNIATSIAILAGSVAVLALLDQGAVWSSVGAVVVLAGVLVAMSALLNKFKPGDLGKLSASLLGLAGSMLIFALAAKMIGGMDGPSLVKGGIAIAAFLGMIVVISKASTSVDAFVNEFGKMMLKLSVALLILAVVTKIFGSMKPETLLKGGGAIAVFLGMMVGMMAATKLIGGTDMSAFSSMMIKLSASLLLMSLAIKILGRMDAKTLIKGGSVIAIFLGIMVGMMTATKLIGSNDMAKFGTMMLTLSMSLLLMSAAIGILGSMDTGTLFKGALVISGIMVIMVGMMAATKLLGRHSYNASKVGVMMLSFAASLLMITASIALLSMIDSSGLAKAVSAIAVIGLIFAGLLAVTKFAKSIKVGTIIALSISVGVLAASIAALSFIDASKLKGATAALSVIMGVFALLVVSTKFINFKAAASMIIMAGVVALLAYILKELATLQVDQALGVATALSELILALSAACLLLGVVGMIGPAAFIGVGVLAALLLVLGAAFAIGLSQLPAIAKQLSKFMDELEPFISGITSVDSSVFESAKLLAETILIFASAGLMQAIGNAFTGGGVSKAFDGFLTWIKELLPVIKDFALELSGEGVDINSDNLNAVIGAAKTLAEAASLAPTTSTIVITALGAYISTTDLKAFTDWFKEVTPIVKDLALSVSAKGVDIDKDAIDAVTGAAKTLAEAASFAPTDTTVTTLIGGYTSSTDLTEFADWIEEVTPIVRDFAIDVSNANIEKTSVEAVATAAKTLAEASSFAPTDTTVVTGIGGYTSSTDLSEFATWIKDVAPVVKDFAIDVSSASIDKKEVEAVATAAKTLAEAAASAPTDTTVVTLIGGYTSSTDLSEFADWIEEVAPIVKDFAIDVSSASIDKKDVETVASAAKSLAEAAASAPTDETITTIFGTYTSTTDLTEFADWIEAIAPTVKDFAMEVSEVKIDKDKVEAVAKAAKSLAEAAASAPTDETIGPLGGVYTSKTNLDSFATWVKEISSTVKDFAIDVSSEQINVDKDAIDAVATAAKTLADAAATAPKSSGVKQAFAGAADLEGFSTWIGEVVPVLKDFSLSLSDGDIEIDTNAVVAVSNAGKLLAEMANLIPKDGGMWDWAKADINYDTFGDNIVTFGEKMAEFSNTVAGKIDVTAVTTVSTAGRDIAAMMTELSLNAGYGGITIGDFGTRILEFADAMVQYSDKVSGIDDSSVASSAAAAKNISETMQNLSGFAYATVDVSSFSVKLTEISDAMNNFSTNTVDVDTSKLSNLVNDISSLITTGSGIDATALTTKLTEISDAMSTFSTNIAEITLPDMSELSESISGAIATIGETSVSGFTDAFSDAGSDAMSAGESMITNLLLGMTKSISRIITTCKTISTLAANGLKNGYQTAYASGKYLVQGFANGISANTYIAVARARAMATAALNAAKNALGIASPSKETYKFGAFFGQGFANAIKDYEPKVYRTSKSMAETAKEGLSNAIGNVRDLIEGGIDDQLTIRPVLDLSDVEAGAGAIGGMFGMRPSVGVLSNIGTINSMMNDRQNGTNRDVISAIEDLGRKIGNTNGDTYNVNGITYDDGSNITNTVKDLIRAAKIERRI